MSITSTITSRACTPSIAIGWPAASTGGGPASWLEPECARDRPKCVKVPLVLAACRHELWLARTRPDRRRSGTGPIREPLPQHCDVRRAKPEGGKHPVAPLIQPLDSVREVSVGQRSAAR